PWQYPWLDRVGHRIDQRFGYVALGLFESEEEIQNSASQAGDVRPGDIRYQDLNEDGLINSFDQKAIGYGSVPQMVCVVNLSAGLKRFELTLFCPGSAMSDLTYSSGPATQPFCEGATIGNLSTEALDRWTPDSPEQNAL